MGREKLKMVAEDICPMSMQMGAGSNLVPGNRHVSGEKCLLIDDEPLCIEIEKEMLEHLGYQVTVIPDAKAAINMINEAPDGFDLVILNKDTSELRGDAFANEVMTVMPGLPVIVCPGRNSRNGQVRTNIKNQPRVLLKPVSMLTMVNTIRSVQRRCIPELHTNP